MLKKLTIPVVLVLVLLLAVGLASAQGQLPGSGWWSGQQIQNVGSGNASIQMTAYDTSGNPFACGSPKSAVPGASVNFLTIVDCTTLSPGFVGSAVVSADQPIAAIVNVVNMTAGRAAGMYTGTDGSDVANQIAFPLMKNNYFGRSTALYIQNASSSTNTINVVVKIGANSYTKTFNSVPANAMVVLGPADTTPPMPNNSYGSASVSGSQPLAGSALEYQAGVSLANNLHAYTALVPQDYAAKVYCPLARNDYFKLNTGIQAQNVGASAQQIRATYTYTVGGGPVQTEVKTQGPVASGASVTFFTPSDLPKGAVGSATVEGVGGGDIAVIVNDETFVLNPNRVTAYTCFPDNSATKTNKVNLPLYKEFYLGDTAGIQVQNVGSSAATIEITYFPTAPSAGAPVKFRSANPVPPNASFTFYGVSSPGAAYQVVSGTPSTLLGTAGGAVIESTQPIVAIVNEEPGTAAGAKPASNQDAKLYEGFNQ